MRSTIIALLVCFAFVSAAVLLLASNGSIISLSNHQVSPSSQILAWEPSSAFGSSTWASAWTNWERDETYVSTSNGGAWSAPILLQTPTSDVYLTWDNKNSRFVVVLLTDLGEGYESVYFGYSNAPFTTWTMSSTPVFTGVAGTYDWDYPSVGVDASGRIIVGAVSGGLYTKVAPSGATSGASFGPQVLVASFGHKARVVATSNLFEAFTVVDNATTYTPQEVDRGTNRATVILGIQA